MMDGKWHLKLICSQHLLGYTFAAINYVISLYDDPAGYDMCVCGMCYTPGHHHELGTKHVADSNRS